MRIARSTAPVASVLLSAALLLLAGPAPASAADCGGSYVRCLNDADLIGNSGALHEQECYADYWQCVRRLLLSY